MKILDFIKKIGTYKKKSKAMEKPILINVNNKENYFHLKKELESTLFKTIRVSSFCRNDDGLPDISKLNKEIKRGNDNKLIIGITEYYRIKKTSDTYTYFKKLIDTKINGVVIILVYKSSKELNKILKSDIRVKDRVVLIDGRDDKEPIINYYYKKNNINNEYGFKQLLKNLENKKEDSYNVYTSVKTENINKEEHNINIYETPFDEIKEKIPNNITQKDGNDENWKYLNEMIEQYATLDLVIENEFENFKYAHKSWEEYSNNTKWLYVLALGKIKDCDEYAMYGKKSARDNINVDEFIKNLYYDFYNSYKDNIDNIDKTDEFFWREYENRKKLLEYIGINKFALEYCNMIKFPKNDIRRLYFLTDLTDIEKKEIIKSVGAVDSKKSAMDVIKKTYNPLYNYVEDYDYEIDFIDTYFREYKASKIKGVLSDKLMELVNDNSNNRDNINKLPTREQEFEAINKEDSKVFWIDSLGYEYVSFISNEALKLGMDIKIKLVRSVVPTITKLNKEFLDQCITANIECIEIKELDDLKHKNPEQGNDKIYPIYLSEELDIIKNALNKTNNMLNSDNKIIWVSDHGSTRGVRLNKNTNRHNLVSKGKSSGRYCNKETEDIMPANAIEDNECYIFTNYDLFAGGRLIGNEVHGGATLEEIIVPIIEFEAKGKKEDIQLELLSHNIVIGKNIMPTLNIRTSRKIKNISIIVEGTKFKNIQYKNNEYIIDIKEIKSAGKHNVLVEENNETIKKFKIHINHAGMKINDDLF